MGYCPSKNKHPPPFPVFDLSTEPGRNHGGSSTTTAIRSISVAPPTLIFRDTLVHYLNDPRYDFQGDQRAIGYLFATKDTAATTTARRTSCVDRIFSTKNDPTNEPNAST